MEQAEQTENTNTASVLDKLPPSFKKFLVENGVDVSIFFDAKDIDNLPRYIRVNPLKTISLQDIQSDLQTELTPIKWIPNVYSIPAETKISYTQAYKNGEIYGIDLSSCSVVLALDPKPNENILDLCCSPGSKLCFIADCMKSYGEEITGSLAGVDINQHRLNVCRTLVEKYGHKDLIKLYCEDGTTFPKTHSEGVLYDKILVDAECTHDGSIKHLFKFGQEKKEKSDNNTEEEKKEEEVVIKTQVEESKKEEEGTQVVTEGKKMSNKERKRREKQRVEHLENLERKKMKKNNEWTSESFEDRVMNEEKITNITSLQKNLVKNAFSLLRPGGILLYSTCSFIKAQNEDVVKFLVEECEETKGKLEVIDVFESSQRSSIPCREGFYTKTVRFDPRTSNTGGMFISKLRKL